MNVGPGPVGSQVQWDVLLTRSQLSVYQSQDPASDRIWCNTNWFCRPVTQLESPHIPHLETHTKQDSTRLLRLHRAGASSGQLVWTSVCLKTQWVTGRDIWGQVSNVVITCGAPQGSVLDPECSFRSSNNSLVHSTTQKLLKHTGLAVLLPVGPPTVSTPPGVFLCLHTHTLILTHTLLSQTPTFTFTSSGPYTAPCFSLLVFNWLRLVKYRGVMSICGNKVRRLPSAPLS